MKTQRRATSKHREVSAPSSIVLAVLILTTSACSFPVAFTCADDADCDLTGGACEAAGVCSQLDPACASGRRYSNRAGSLSKLCVPPSADGALSSDAALTIDASGQADAFQAGNADAGTDAACTPSYPGEIYFEDGYTIASWLGWDDSDPDDRNLGAGQRIVPSQDLSMAQFALNFSMPFNSVTSGGPGVAVDLHLDLRDESGAVLVSAETSVPASFSSGWIWWDIQYDLLQSTTYNFTAYLVDASNKQVRSAVYFNTENKFPTGQRLGADTSIPGNGAITEWETWGLAGSSLHDLHFWIRPEPSCGQ